MLNGDTLHKLQFMVAGLSFEGGLVFLLAKQSRGGRGRYEFLKAMN